MGRKILHFNLAKTQLPDLIGKYRQARGHTSLIGIYFSHSRAWLGSYRRLDFWLRGSTMVRCGILRETELRFGQEIDRHSWSLTSPFDGKQ